MANNDEKTVKQRLIEYLEYKKIGRNKFEEMANISLGYITKLKYAPKPAQLEKIMHCAPDLNKVWLLTGDGEMLNDSLTPNISYERGQPYYDVDFIGGYDLIFNDQTTNPDYMIDFPPYNREGVVWCNITGRSMSPTLEHGDIVAIREVKGWRDFLPLGEIYALVTSNDLRTIKIVRKGKDADHLLLVPINKESYDEQEINKSQVERVFKVLGCVKKL